MRPSRRDFVGGSVATVVAATTPLGRALAAGSPPDLVDVEGQDPAKMVAAALDALGGIGKFVRPGDYVVIKPNAGFANPASWATTTHPDTVVALAKACLEAKAKRVTVLEFPLGKGKRCLDRCGLSAALASVPAVKVKVLGDPSDFKKVKIPGGVATDSVEIAKAALSADVLINVPNAKAHNDTGVSFGMKNAMGLIYNRRVFHTHLDIHQAIADLARVIKPHLTIVDATRVLLTNGPAGPGETAALGRLVAAPNVVSADAYALTLARYNQRRMSLADAPHIKLAGEAGLGQTDLSRLQIRKVRA